MNNYSDTEIGGSNREFGTTHWTQIFGLDTIDENKKRAILGQLLLQYWKPCYCFVRRKGHGNTEAKDIVQDFFESIITKNTLFENADPAKGKFRSYLRKTLQNHINSLKRKEGAEKRGGGLSPVSLDELEGATDSVPNNYISPEEAFDYLWAKDLLQKAFDTVKKECEKNNFNAHWQIFCERVLNPILYNKKETSIPDLCKTYNISSQAQASNMVVTVKRKFEKTFRDIILQHVGSDKDLEEEIQYIMTILSKQQSSPNYEE